MRKNDRHREISRQRRVRDTPLLPEGRFLVNIVLVSTYELGRQPFGLASPVAWLRQDGHDVHVVDLAVDDKLPEHVIRGAALVGCYVPMHTATRLAAAVARRVRELNPQAHLVCYGLYASMNEDYLRSLGAQTILGGEFEQGLIDLARRLPASSDAGDGTAGADAGSDPQDTRYSTVSLQIEPVVSLARQRFITPDRSDLPDLDRYAHFIDAAGQSRRVGYTEATRGCKHTCRHCPIVPVYGGHFRVVEEDVVLADIDNLVAAGAEHITFGDPDFFNGPRHAIDLVTALHDRYSDLTYDVTIKVEHLVKQSRHLPVLAATGCALITCAVESFDEHVLTILDKRHSAEDFEFALRSLRSAGIAMNPTFVAFTPYLSLDGYLEFLHTLRRLDLVGSVAPVQYAIRLLLPRGSWLLEVPETQEVLGEFDEQALCYSWTHPDARMDRLQAAVSDYVEAAQCESVSRGEIFAQVLTLACRAAGRPDPTQDELPGGELVVGPHVDEPWYCCAEPTDNQMMKLEVGV